MHQLRVRRPQRVRPDAPRLGRAGGEPFDDDVGAGSEVTERLLTLGGAQVFPPPGCVAALYLASAASSYTTGATIRIDGGITWKV